MSSIAFFELVLEILLIIISRAFSCNKPCQHCLSFSKAILTAGMEWEKCVWCLPLPLTHSPSRDSNTLSLYTIHTRYRPHHTLLSFSLRILLVFLSLCVLITPFSIYLNAIHSSLTYKLQVFYFLGCFFWLFFFCCCLFVTSRIKIYIKTLLY